ncbi:MAG: hydroxymethylglutaryl-CoA synthase [Chloroflexota bacterium]
MANLYYVCQRGGDAGIGVEQGGGRVVELYHCKKGGDMVGITSYGGYVPLYRLARDEVARAWGTASLGGEKAVANFDEDSITMAVSAAMDCLKGLDARKVDALYLASTTLPFKEKQSAATVATAADLPRNALTLDVTGSLRSGTLALRTALDAVKSGSARQALMVAVDCRLGMPGTDYEQAFGDGAAALMIGSSGVVAEIEGVYTHFNELLDNWRVETDRYVKSWEERFIVAEGYQANVEEAVAALFEKHKLSAKDFSRIALYAPDARRHREMAAELGLDYKAQLSGELFAQVGNTGTALPVMMLVRALEEARPGERILLISYGDGCDAFVLRVTDEIEKVRQRRGVKGYLQSKRQLHNYETYVRYKQLMSVETGRKRQPPISSAALLWRERRAYLGLYGSRCCKCGRLFFPPQRICYYCQAKDDYEPVRLAGMKGKLDTFSKDVLSLSLDPPTVVSVVNLEGGARFAGQMTDRDPDAVKVGMEVELTLRKFHEAEGYPNYFWKCQPVR